MVLTQVRYAYILNPLFNLIIGNSFDDKAVEILAEAIKVSGQQKIIIKVNNIKASCENSKFAHISP